MENNIFTHRQMVADRIQKSIVYCNTAIEKAEVDELEKGKWQVGMTKQYQGKTYKVSGFNASGNPLWRLVKDDKGGSQQADDSKSKQTDEEYTVRVYTDRMNSKRYGLFLGGKIVADYGTKEEANAAKKLREEHKTKSQRQQGLTTVQKNTDQNYKQYEFVGTKQPKDWEGWKKLIGDDVWFDGYRNMYVKGDNGKFKQIGKVVTDDKFYFNKIDNEDIETDVKSDNYKTASEKTGRHPKRSEYGWKNSAAGYDSRELDD